MYLQMAIMAQQHKIPSLQRQARVLADAHKVVNLQCLAHEVPAAITAAPVLQLVQ